jgi:hypothetical protein
MLGKKHLLALTLLLVLVALVGVGVVAASGRPLVADLSWENEVPPASGTSATGWAEFTLNQGQEEICFHITVENLSGPLVADHIHVGEAGVAGPPVVNLGGALDGCVSASADTIKAIRQNPEGYYLNLHTALNPGGEVRGQLEKPGE